jgi:hypothetical protein
MPLGNGRKLRIKQKEQLGWREYFTEEEVQTVLKQLKEGKEYEESESSGSDSQPSDGNFSENEDKLMRDIVDVEEEKGVRRTEEEESAPAPLPFTPSPLPISQLPIPTPQSTTPLPPQPLPKKPVSLPKPSKRSSLSQPPVHLMSATQPPALLDNPSARPPAYPVSDISSILRGTHRGHASFDYSDFRRPRIHREVKRAKRSSSPVFFIESYTVKKEPQARTIKTLSSTQRLGTGWSAYASKQGLAATTRYAAARNSRRQFEGSSKWGVKSKN